MYNIVNRAIVSHKAELKLHKMINIPIPDVLYDNTFLLPHLSMIFPPQRLYITAANPPNAKSKLILDLSKFITSLAYKEIKGPFMVRLNKRKREERAKMIYNIFLLNKFLKESNLLIFLRW